MFTRDEIKSTINHHLGYAKPFDALDVSIKLENILGDLDIQATDQMIADIKDFHYDVKKAAEEMIKRSVKSYIYEKLNIELERLNETTFEDPEALVELVDSKTLFKRAVLNDAFAELKPMFDGVDALAVKLASNLKDKYEELLDDHRYHENEYYDDCEYCQHEIENIELEERWLDHDYAGSR